jgi:POLQ-like helicase
MKNCCFQFDLSLATFFENSDGPYGKHIDGISRSIVHYFRQGSGQDEFFEHASILRRIAYDIGSPRQLLFADVNYAIIKKRFENSTWHCLPQYSDLSINQWQPALQKENFIRELWPGQHLLGRQNVFKGKSAMVQMPTSAGKTKATELIIRSAFLAGRTSLVVVVAPFRALCHEIRNDLVETFRNESININELSDVFQVDFNFERLLEEQQVLVITPEKLVYILRHVPELAKYIGLLIYDEGHQFDNGTRGVTYELLVTSLKMMVPKETQTVLISAVIKNATAVGKWLNGEESEVVSGINLIPTYRTVAFASWLDLLGRLEFVDQTNPDNQEFFVPRIIEQQQLQLRGRERKKQVFPEKTEGQDIALYLGLKIAPKGSVAIFCGKKVTAFKLCEKVVEVYSRGLNFKKPIEYSDQNEIERLQFLYERNLGSEVIASKSAALGIFAHHSNTPHGIRLAVEYAMKEGLAKFVICTSTLAQGVNLPIRYLIITSVYQGQDKIKVRDFHNLIGRAGRSGMYTEGSILFADPIVYDKRNTYEDSWRWQQVKNLLEVNNSEPCISALATIFDPLYDDNRNSTAMEPLDFVRAYVEDKVELLIQEIASQQKAKGVKTERLEGQVAWKMNIISAVESYLMTHWGDLSSLPQGTDITELATETLAYFLADDEQKSQIIELFRLLSENIVQKIPEASRKVVFGKTLYGVQNSIAIEEWVKQHLEELLSCNDHDELLTTLWPLISANIQNGTFKKCTPKEVLKEFTSKWVQANSFGNLLQLLEAEGVRIGTGPRPRHPTIEHVVDICENGLSYDGMLLVSAVTEIIEIVQLGGDENLTRNLQELQRKLKYGLPSSAAITLYEMGFADRIVSMELSSITNLDISDRRSMVLVLKANEQKVKIILEKYPRYFMQVLNEVLGISPS